jgi:UDP-N-acetylmuramyl pentapeptide synthase
LPTLEEDKIISGITIDSRIIERDSLFIAIEGHQFDGHDYVKEALKKGRYRSRISSIFS